ncbi:ATPase subunit of ABC transporter with duplicated ATPase domains, partial [Streptomyces sp. V1I6]|nr:ATPase subunit of ABC transporter with duplicated ATPase domains [Streptomyces sp. V1I6]
HNHNFTTRAATCEERRQTRRNAERPERNINAEATTTPETGAGRRRTAATQQQTALKTAQAAQAAQQPDPANPAGTRATPTHVATSATTPPTTTPCPHRTPR